MIEEQGMDELPGDDREAILKYLSTYYGGVTPAFKTNAY